MGSAFDFISNLNMKVSKRPVILLGAGIRLSGMNEKHIKKLMKKIRVPYLLTWGGFDILDHNDDLNFNTIGVYGHRSSNFIVQNSDLLITIGCRLDTRTTGSRVDTFAPSAKIICVDIDQNELNKNRGTKIFKKILQDASIFTMNLIKSKQIGSNSHQEWIDYCLALKSKYQYEKESSFKGKYVEIYSFIRVLSEYTKANSIIIPDDGGHLTGLCKRSKLKEVKDSFQLLVIHPWVTLFLPL